MSRVERNQSLYEDMFEEKNRRGHKTAGRILRAAGIALMVLVVAACLSLIVPRLAGYEGYVVVSGSMEPTIPVGSIIYSKQTDPALLLLEGWLLNEIGRRLKLRG